MEQINWWIIVAIVVAVAIITSLVTMNLTGNVIKVRKTNYGTDIYTKAEVDSLFDSLKTSGLIMFFTDNLTSVQTQVSVEGFNQQITEGLRTASIQLGGDNLILDKNDGSQRKVVVSPGSVHVSENNVFSTRITSEYLEFCNNNSCMMCIPDFVTKTIKCN